jgi:Galactose oxidase-like, Early set domain
MPFNIKCRFVRCFFLLGILAATVWGQPNKQGTWSPLANWPLIPLHTILTVDGRLLTYGTTASGQQTGKFIYDVWNPKAGGIGIGHTTLPNNTSTDLFCSGQINLIDGRTLLTGGDNFVNGQTNNTPNSDFNIFTASDNSLVHGGSLNRPRWYGTLITLPSGDVYLQGGNGGADHPELWHAGNFTLLNGADTSGLNWYYPRNFVAPDGRMFGLDTNGTMYYVNPGGAGQMTLVGSLPAGNAGTTSSAAMFQPGKILQIGDGAGAVVIDVTSGSPNVTPTQPMATVRKWVTTTILADGQVLATGGSGADNQLVGVNNTAAIWNPATGTWTVGPSGAVARLYHSIAIMLPDASVLVAGGGAPGPLVNTNGEIYYPPYLYNAAGTFAARPTITAAPTAIDAATNFTVSFGGSATRISRVTLVKTGSVTHSFNVEQRFLPLNFTASGNNLTVTAPANTNVATPGYYLLFVFNENNVPSEAKIVKLNAPAAVPLTDTTIGQALGPGWGPTFGLSCNGGEALVGIAGASSNYLDSAGPMCVTVNAQGAWTGSPVARGVAGGPGGAAYTRVCPVNQAVGQFQGHSGSWVDQVQIACQPLTGPSGLTGAPIFQPFAGGPGGLPEGPFGCPNTVAYGVRGIAGTYVGSFGLICTPPLADSTIGLALGPGWGASFTLTCNSGEVLAGIAGGAGNYVDRVGPLCVTVNAQGAWTGTPVARGVAGSAGDVAFTKTCPVNQAVGQFRGRSGSWVDQVEISCQNLASPILVTGSPVFQGGAGGPGGASSGPFGCAGTPAYGVRGIAGTYVGQFGLYCTKP